MHSLPWSGIKKENRGKCPESELFPRSGPVLGAFKTRLDELAANGPGNSPAPAPGDEPEQRVGHFRLSHPVLPMESQLTFLPPPSPWAPSWPLAFPPWVLSKVSVKSSTRDASWSLAPRSLDACEDPSAWRVGLENFGLPGPQQEDVGRRV